MLSEAEGVPIGRALTNEEQKRLLETAGSNPEWETFLVSQTFVSWNQLTSWLRRIDHLRRAA